MLRAIIVDDEELAGKRLQGLLAEHDEIEVCDTFMNPLDALKYVKAHPVDLAFLDISMPELGGIRLSSLLLQVNGDMDIVFVTGYDNYAVQAFDVSALDYLMKPVTGGRMAKTLEKVRRRHPIATVQPDEGVNHLGQGILTEREAKVLHLISNGLSNKDIADKLDISAETVKYHIKNLYRKFQVNNRVQVVIRAKESGILV